MCVYDLALLIEAYFSIYIHYEFKFEFTNFNNLNFKHRTMCGINILDYGNDSIMEYKMILNYESKCSDSI